MRGGGALLDGFDQFTEQTGRGECRDGGETVEEDGAAEQTRVAAGQRLHVAAHRRTVGHRKDRGGPHRVASDGWSSVSRMTTAR